MFQVSLDQWNISGKSDLSKTCITLIWQSLDSLRAENPMGIIANEFKNDLFLKF